MPGIRTGQRKFQDDIKGRLANAVGAKGSGSGQRHLTGKFIPKGWYKVSVPTTIIAGLLANKVYDFDPFYGMNFEKLKDPALNKPWWFRKEFSLPVSQKREKRRTEIARH